jgi:hypothetical protein
MEPDLDFTAGAFAPSETDSAAAKIGGKIKLRHTAKAKDLKLEMIQNNILECFFKQRLPEIRRFTVMLT